VGRCGGRIRGGPRRAAGFEGEPVRKWGRKRRMEGGSAGRSAGGWMWAGEGVPPPAPLLLAVTPPPWKGEEG
jgi:hypothetical protein